MKQKPTAHPREFNKETAMLAIFDEYNTEKSGTLIPLPLTKKWEIESAKEIAEPLMAEIYTESGKQKGVLVLSRHKTSECSHSEFAHISVYVFAFNGSEWIFEKGKKDITEGGDGNCNPPPTKLIAIGDNQYAIASESGFRTQGVTTSIVSILSLSDAKIAIIGNFSLLSEEDYEGNYQGDEDPASSPVKFFSQKDKGHYAIEHRGKCFTRIGTAEYKEETGKQSCKSGTLVSTYGK